MMYQCFSHEFSLSVHVTLCRVYRFLAIIPSRPAISISLHVVTTKAFMHSNTPLQKQSAQHSWAVSGQSPAGVQATSGAKAPGFEALPHLRAVVEQTSGSECIRQLLGAGLREMACTPKEALKAECTEPQFLGIRKFSCGGSK